MHEPVVLSALRSLKADPLVYINSLFPLFSFTTGP